jgi:dihydroceramidase
MNEKGYWYPETANIDWCESNYIITYYIAEWYNTLSNLIPVIYSSYILYKYKNTSSIYSNIHIMLIFVYLGSFSFHATLSKTGQLLDELPMLIINIYLIYILENCNKKKLIENIIIKCIFLILMYIYNDSPLPFQLSFIFFNLKLIKKVIELLIKFPILYKRTEIKKSLQFYLLASLCWILDLYLCSYVKYFYLHAFWHILSYMGCIYLLNFIFIYLTFINSEYILPKHYQDILNDYSLKIPDGYSVTISNELI